MGSLANRVVAGAMSMVAGAFPVAAQENEVGIVGSDAFAMSKNDAIQNFQAENADPFSKPGPLRPADFSAASTVLKNAFAGVCDAGKVKPMVYTVMAMSDELSDGMANAMVAMHDNMHAAVDEQLKDAPYLASVIGSMQTQAQGILAQQPAFENNVRALKFLSDSSPRERMLNAMGALEGVCQAEGRLTGAFTDTINAMDKKKASAEFDTIRAGIPTLALPGLDLRMGR